MLSTSSFLGDSCGSDGRKRADRMHHSSICPSSDGIEFEITLIRKGGRGFFRVSLDCQLTTVVGNVTEEIHERFVIRIVYVNGFISNVLTVFIPTVQL